MKEENIECHNGYRIPAVRIYKLIIVLLLIFTMIQSITGHSFAISVSSSMKSDIPTFKLKKASEADLSRLEEFIAINRGKLVYIHITIPARYCDTGKIGRFDRISITPSDCPSDLFLYDCAHYHLLIDGRHHILERCRKVCLLSGYFIVNPDRYMHQGIHYLLKSIPCGSNSL
ncbi:MAG: hypothetical protein JRE29_02850 [Deltaproteobacteria bacterium]|nr:hypothetical protein [Deltaproteobacteria bacterium]